MTDPTAGQGDLAPGELWVLVDGNEEEIGELTRYASRKRYSADILGQKLQEFTDALRQALSKIQHVGEGFELSTVSVDVRLSAEAGFELIAKAGIAGGITLTFKRSEPTPPNL